MVSKNPTLFLGLLILVALSPKDGYCVTKKVKKHQHTKIPLLYPITQSNKYAGFVVNIDTGEIIYSRKAKEIRHPASLTKMMTLYLTFDALRSGKLKMQQVLVVSPAAARQPSMNMNLKAGATITVQEAIYALIVRSANDIAVTLSEAVAGSEARFVEKMNLKAKKLGLRNTNFCNPHGLHDKKQITTAYDMAMLSLALQKHHAAYYPMFAKTSFTYNGQVIPGHNKVLTRYKCANGGKTGYIDASKSNIVISTKSPEGRLIVVVFGGETSKIRDDHTISLLQSAYESIKAKKIASASRSLKKQNSPA